MNINFDTVAWRVGGVSLKQDTTSDGAGETGKPCARAWSWVAYRVTHKCLTGNSAEVTGLHWLLSWPDETWFSQLYVVILLRGYCSASAHFYFSLLRQIPAMVPRFQQFSLISATQVPGTKDTCYCVPALPSSPALLLSHSGPWNPSRDAAGGGGGMAAGRAVCAAALQVETAKDPSIGSLISSVPVSLKHWLQYFKAYFVKLIKTEQFEIFPVEFAKASLLRKTESGTLREWFDPRARDGRITEGWCVFLECLSISGENARHFHLTAAGRLKPQKSWSVKEITLLTFIVLHREENSPENKNDCHWTLCVWRALMCGGAYVICTYRYGGQRSILDVSQYGTS